MSGRSGIISPLLQSMNIILGVKEGVGPWSLTEAEAAMASAGAGGEDVDD